MDDFMLRAIAAGVGIALVASPLGAFVVWRRLPQAVGDPAVFNLAYVTVIGADQELTRAG